MSESQHQVPKQETLHEVHMSIGSKPGVFKKIFVDVRDINRHETTPNRCLTGTLALLEMVPTSVHS